MILQMLPLKLADWLKSGVLSSFNNQENFALSADNIAKSNVGTVSDQLALMNIVNFQDLSLISYLDAIIFFMLQAFKLLFFGMFQSLHQFLIIFLKRQISTFYFYLDIV